MTQTTPVAVIQQFLANTTNPEVVNQLVAPDATYISLNYENKDLKRILPWTGTSSGPKAFIDTFTLCFNFGRHSTSSQRKYLVVARMWPYPAALLISQTRWVKQPRHLFQFMLK
jgi:hypothetical protein